jgi:GNAT superfamily N-acetyltransferase
MAKEEGAMGVFDRRLPDVELRIEEYDPRDLGEVEWKSFFALHEQRRRGLFPRDPLPSREKRRKYMASGHPSWDIYWWRAFAPRDARFVALGGCWWESTESPSYEANRHIGYVDVYVDTGWRCKGVGTAALRAILSQARAQGKTLIRAENVEPRTGVPLCHKLGGKVVAERHFNRLYLADVDWSLMEQWRREGATRASGATIERFEDVPKRDIEQYCQLYTEVANQAPAGDLAGEMVVTPQQRRQDEDEVRKNGYEWHTMVSREPDGTLSGLTEMFYAPVEPWQLEQELTGVGEAYRGRGLGKWLKAEMLRFIVDRYPEAVFVNTGNADQNAPMVSINERMGFREILAQPFYEFDINQLADSLDLLP